MTKSKKIIITLSVFLFIFVAYSIFLMYGLYIKDLNYLTSDVIVNNVAYRYDNSLQGYVVSGFGKLESNNPRHLTDEEAVVVIDEKVKGKPVVEIKDYAFMGTHIKSITLSLSIKRIGKEAFDGSSLECITLNEGLIEIDDYAFQHCHNLEQIQLPSTLKKIGYYSFAYTSIKEICLKDVTVGGGAFNECRFLEKVTFEGGIKIEDYTFNDTAISVLDLTGVDSVGKYAFSNNIISYVFIPKNLYYLDSTTNEYKNKMDAAVFFKVINLYIEENYYVPLEEETNYLSYWENIKTGITKEEYYEALENNNIDY